MKKVILLVLLIISIYFLCKPKGFYKYSGSGGQNRIPLIYPYEIISSYNKSPWYTDRYHWSYHAESATVDSVGIKDSIIILYLQGYQEVSFYDKNGWYIIDTKAKANFFYENLSQFQEFLSQRNIMKYKLYVPESIFEKFKTNLELPPEWPN